jgi:8-oxo-dGTP pyrophosphatase MutT (NUDIX family)
VIETTYLGMTFPYHRRSPERLHLFLAEVGEFIGAERDIEEEGMEVIWKTEPEIQELILNNQIENSHATGHWAQLQSLRISAKIPARAVAIIIRDKDGNILLKKRGPKSHDSIGKWENTGGKLDKDEDIVQGLKREVKEELDIEVKVTSQINSRVTTNPAGDTYTVYLFEGFIDSGKPKIMEPGKCTEIAWVNPEDLNKYDLAEYTAADFKFTGELQ